MNWRAYYRLMRFHKPLGILLLWIPTAFALWFVNQGRPAWRLVLYFFLGTVCMRAAGCVLNDIVDRHVDQHVSRTKRRPLTAGDVGLVETLILLMVLLFMAYFIVAQLPVRCFYEALFALLITIIYPFCKRFFEAPQLILGLAFSMGIPMAYTASGVVFDGWTIYLFCLNFAWIIAYDTMYAMADRADDLTIGVKSTAVLFASYDRLVIGLLQGCYHFGWLIFGLLQHANPWFYLGWLMAFGLLIYQQLLLGTRHNQAYFKAFSLNGWYGLVMWLGLFLFGILK